MRLAQFRGRGGRAQTASAALRAASQRAPATRSVPHAREKPCTRAWCRLAAGADAFPPVGPQIQNDLAVLTKRLSHLNDSIARKVASRSEYDKTIAETEAAYLKILESSQTLLTVLKRETVTCVFRFGGAAVGLRELR